MINLQKMCSMTYDDTHIVLYDGTNVVAKLDCPILFDGLKKDIDLKKFGDYTIAYTAGAADQPCGVLFWIRKES